MPMMIIMIMKMIMKMIWKMIMIMIMTIMMKMMNFRIVLMLSKMGIFIKCIREMMRRKIERKVRMNKLRNI